MRSGCAADAQRMGSARALWLKQKKTGVPMTPPPNRPKTPLMPHHHHLHLRREFCPKKLAAAYLLPLRSLVGGDLRQTFWLGASKATQNATKEEEKGKNGEAVWRWRGC
jgi:hypothetical protein